MCVSVCMLATSNVFECVHAYVNLFVLVCMHATMHTLECVRASASVLEFGFVNQAVVRKLL